MLFLAIIQISWTFIKGNFLWIKNKARELEWNGKRANIRSERKIRSDGKANFQQNDSQFKGWCFVQQFYSLETSWYFPHVPILFRCCSHYLTIITIILLYAICNKWGWWNCLKEKFNQITHYIMAERRLWTQFVYIFMCQCFRHFWSPRLFSNYRDRRLRAHLNSRSLTH